jgi:hypothetical protein
MNLATPFQFDSISLPAWAVIAIRHTRQAAVHSRIVLKAFSKTIAPVIATTTKEVGRYYWSCFQGAEKWTLDRQPISSAVRAVHAELVSAEAKATYSRIGKLMHKRLINGLVIAHYGIAALIKGFTTAQSAYRTAVKLYRAIYGRLNPSEPMPEFLPSVGMAIASTEIAEALADYADVAEADIQAKAEGEAEAIALQSAEAVEPPALEPVLEQKPDPEAMDELATALDVPGAIAKPRGSASKAKASTKAAAQPKEARAKAGARGGK